MAIKLEYDNPAFPKDTEFDVCGVIVPNGGSVELTEEQEQKVIAQTGLPAKEAFEGNDMLKVSGTAHFTGKKLDELIPASDAEVASAELAKDDDTEEGGEA
jgi:hypothetical protein